MIYLLLPPGRPGRFLDHGDVDAAPAVAGDEVLEEGEVGVQDAAVAPGAPIAAVGLPVDLAYVLSSSSSLVLFVLSSSSSLFYACPFALRDVVSSVVVCVVELL